MPCDRLDPAERRTGAADFHAAAYHRSLEAGGLCEFTRTMQVYPAIFGKNTTTVLPGDSELFPCLRGMPPIGD